MIRHVCFSEGEHLLITEVQNNFYIKFANNLDALSKVCY